MQNNNENNIEREGFALSIENLFTLMRMVYYSKTESENRYFSKDGGVISGNVTVQGNINVMGQTYVINTQDLNVKDYTITLAKDNENTLTSMVGMVVPKYDGTNYGFFGWDADGFAYVGDLTNYDGSSAILKASHSGLQKIATIDTTNTIAPEVGKVYLYDSTNSIFKKAATDNNNYVVKNGELVEVTADMIDDTSTTNKFVNAQEKKNIDNSLYNLGAYDTYSVSNGVVSVVRKTGYIDLDSLSWSYTGVGYWIANTPYVGASTNGEVATMKCNNYAVLSANDVYNGTQGIALRSNGEVWCRNGSNTTQPSGIVQVELSTTYTDKYIENTPNIALDQNGATWLQNEWKKGLNLFNPNAIVRKSGYYGDSGGWNSHNEYNCYGVNLKAGTYKLTTVAANWYGSISKLNSDGSWNSILLTLGTHTSETITLSSDTFIGISIQNNKVSNGVMLNEGTHIYPYEAYNQKEHITNDEATLLKQEEEKCRNLIDFNSNTFRIENNGAYVAKQTIYLPVGTYTFTTSREGYKNLVSSDGGTTDIDVAKQTLSSTFNVLTAGNFIVRFTSTTYDFSDLVMLNKGSKAKPYQPYNQKEHITNEEATFLKDEYNGTVNLWDEDWEVGFIDAGNGAPSTSGLTHNNSIRSKNYTSCKNNETYIAEVSNPNVSFDICWYNSSKGFVGYNTTNYSDRVIIQAPSSAFYFKISASNNAGYSSKLSISKSGNIIHQKDLLNVVRKRYNHRIIIDFKRCSSAISLGMYTGAAQQSGNALTSTDSNLISALLTFTITTNSIAEITLNDLFGIGLINNQMGVIPGYAEFVYRISSTNTTLKGVVNVFSNEPLLTVVQGGHIIIVGALRKNYTATGFTNQPAIFLSMENFSGSGLIGSAITDVVTEA